jgi:hypothetical protein
MFTTIVIDEAHHVPATSYLDFLDAMEDAVGPDDEGPLVLGVTATPARAGVADEGRAARADALEVAKDRRAGKAPARGPKGDQMTTKTVEVDSPVLDPISSKPCVDKATGRPYVYGPDGKPVVAPIVVPGPAERVGRLEDALVALALFTVENQRVRFDRSLMAADAGTKVARFLDVIEAERAT